MVGCRFSEKRPLGFGTILNFGANQSERQPLRECSTGLEEHEFNDLAEKKRISAGSLKGKR
jgi:hypothetical protein